MFDQIAHRYDLLNRLMSLGLDRRWRRALVDSLPAGRPSRILDIATGTADVAIAIARAHPQMQVTGLDPSPGMLAIAREKIERLGLTERLDLIEGDAQDLPAADHTFDAVCISFGIRNVPSRPRALAEMKRVTRPGGRVVVLELSEPRGPARLWVHHVVPRLGAWLSGRREYRYLQASIAAFPPPAAFVAMMEDAGLCQVSARPMTLGAAHLFTGDVLPDDER
jgi:demethylmenaquinone methyltransferase/2-methoxy-6-polyprenyl-1,4-benzoquinol methylase